MQRTTAVAVGIALVAAATAAALLANVGPSAPAAEALPPPGTDRAAFQPGGPPQVEDVLGDARLRNPEWARSAASSTCWFAGPAAAPACTAPSRLPYVPPVVGLPAPPGYDLVSMRLDATPTDLVISLVIGALDEDFTDVVADDGSHYTVWGACWGEECVYLYGYKPNGVERPVVEALHDWYSDECNDWWWCSHHVDHEIEYGSPATIRLFVPRTILADGDAPIEDAIGASQVHEVPKGMPSWGVRTPLGGYGGAFGFQNMYLADVTDRAPAVAFDTPMSPPRPGDGMLAFPETVPDMRTDLLDIVASGLVETPGTLTLWSKVAELPETIPDDHGYFTAIGLPSGRVYMAWFSVIDGELVSEAGYCAGYPEGRCEWQVLPMELGLATGSPGWVNVTLERAALEPLARGDLVNMLWSAGGPYARQEEVLPTNDVGVRYGTSPGVIGDWTAPLPPYWLAYDTVAGPPATAEGPLQDPRGDTERPPLVTEAARAQYDITSLDLLGRSPTETRITLAIDDLSQVKVPPPYESLLYAVALETPTGPFMVGFLKTRETTGPGQQEFFCSQDVGLLTGTPSDPLDVVRVPIQGLVSAADATSDRARGASGGAGSVSFLVPHSCFGDAPAGAFEAARAFAGAYLYGPRSDVHAVDTLASPGPVTLGAATVAAVPAPWYASPFGLDNFWDMFGLFAAVATTGVGAALVQRRRSVLRRYLAQIERALAEHPEARPREAALRDIRARVKADLVAGRISEGHYVIVDRRLDEHLTSARLASLAQAFDDLPVGVLTKLQELLADGEMSREEYRLFCTHLERTRLTDDAKEDVRRRVALWVQQDG